VRTIPTDKRYGLVIGLVVVEENSNILLIDQAGKIIRLPATEVRAMGRQAKGVRLIKLDEGQYLAAIVSFAEEDHDEDGGVASNSSVPGQKAMGDDHDTLLFSQENSQQDVTYTDESLDDHDYLA